MSAKTEEILESLKSLSLLEASELVKQIEEAFGVSAAASAGVVMASPGAAGADGDGGATEEKTEFDVVLDYKGLTIKEMSDLRSRLQTTKGICKVTKNSLMRKAIDGDSNWNDLESLLTGTNAFVLIKEDVGGAVKAIQSFQKDTKKSETKGALFEGRLLSDSEIKEIASLPSKEVLMAKIAGALNGVATKIAISINEVPSGLARSLKQHSEKSES